MCHSHALCRRAHAAFVACAALPSSFYRRRPRCRQSPLRLAPINAFHVIAPSSHLLSSKRRYDRLQPRRSASIASVALRWRWDRGRRVNRRLCPSTRRYNRLVPRRLSSQSSRRAWEVRRTPRRSRGLFVSCFFCRPRDHRPHDRRVVAIVTSSRSSRPRDRRILASPASENRLIVACVFRIARSPPSPRAIDGGRSARPPLTCCSRRRVRALSFEPVARSSLSRSLLQRSSLQHCVSSLRK